MQKICSSDVSPEMFPNPCDMTAVNEKYSDARYEAENPGPPAKSSDVKK